jgi:ABC-type phosphate transport system ATPase subunit
VVRCRGTRVASIAENYVEDDTEKMFSNPERGETEDYVTGRFG